MALGGPWGGFGWLWVVFRPYFYVLLSAFYSCQSVALGGFAPPFEIRCWMFDVRCSMFRTVNRPGSQRVGMGLGVGPSGAFLPSWPLRTRTVRGPIQAGIRLVFPRRGITCG